MSSLAVMSCEVGSWFVAGALECGVVTSSSPELSSPCVVGMFLPVGVLLDAMTTWLW